MSISFRSKRGKKVHLDSLPARAYNFHMDKKIEYDYILKGGRIADVKVGKLVDADIGILGSKIAAVGCLDDASAKEILNVSGKIVSPGFIDAHVHIESSMVAPAEFAKAVLAHGTTAVIADPHEIVNVGGAEGMDAFLKMANDAAIDIFTAVPSSVPATPFDTNGAGEFTADDMKKYVGMPNIAGLGEVMCYPEVFSRDKKILDKIALFRDKTVDGHAVGIPPEKIPEYAAAGISNDHECTSFAEAKLRLDNGMNVYVREGSAAHDLKAILSGVIEFNKNAELNGGEKIDLGRFAFCTDDKHLSTIKKYGHIDENVRMAAELGFSICDAIRIASENPAEFYKLYNRGSIEVGRLADIAVLSDEKASRVDYVFKNGKLVAKDAELTFNFAKTTDKIPFMLNSVKYKDFLPADFNAPIKKINYAIGLENGQLITRLLKLSPEEFKEANLVATIERYGKNGNFSICGLCGYGIKNAAIATSVSHDSHNVVVAGDNTYDMACAVNRLKAIGGGYVIASHGKILGELELEIAGLMSSTDAETVQNKIAELNNIALSLGVNPEIDPFITLSFVALPVIPFVRLLDTGLFDVLKMKFIE